VPAINTLIHFYGICAHVSSNGFLGIEIEGITMNIGPPASITGPGAPSDDGGSPSKKRRFQTHASPRTPALATSSSQPLFSAM